MTRRLALTIGIVAILLSVAPLSAHDDFRIIGTVLKVSDGKLDIKQTKTGKTFSMKTNQATVITRDKKKVTASDLKAGTNVVVDATGDSAEDLLVLEVMIVPVPAK